MITIVLLKQRSRLSGPFKYLARFQKVYRKFSRSIWKKVSAQNRRFSQNIPSWLWAPFLAHNWAETFFQISPETFLWASCTHPRYLEGLLSSYLCVSKKNHDHTTHRADYMSGKAEKLRFWKNEAANQLGIFWENLLFWAETFFQMLLENFL